MLKVFLSCFLFFHIYQKPVLAQLKFLVEDFEGMPDGPLYENQNGIFTYGNTKAFIEKNQSTGNGYSGTRSLYLTLGKKTENTGWGIGIGMFVDLMPETDFINFYFKSNNLTAKCPKIKISIKDDDDNDGKYDERKDDNWSFVLTSFSDDAWHLMSIPLNFFHDNNFGGDGIFNINHKKGKLLIVNLAFSELKNYAVNQSCFFDFISFSKGKLPVSNSIFEPQKATVDDYCQIGSWTEEGRKGHFLKIADSFESNFQKWSSRKLDVIHFFHAFSVTEGTLNSNLLSSGMLKEMLLKGYTPMITFETKFVNAGKNYKQPSLKDILNGTFDYLLIKWAKSVKDAQGIIYVRFLHEFNGDWYPWSIAHNGNNPLLLVKAFQHINKIFKKESAFNAKFIWCPNSISKPQASWNNILDAYPGDQYVDFVGVDVYNGAGDESRPLWRSFRKEVASSYFLLTNHFPSKPVFICETACRERSFDKRENSEKKSDWIFQMGQALQSDLNKVRLISWFDENTYFKINSSEESLMSFLNNIWLNNYFQKK